MSLKNAKTKTIKKTGLAKDNTLRTRWFDQAKASQTWKEYPRPSMVRDNWINLNGMWEYAFTDLDSSWPSFDPDAQILVPFSPESELSGVMRQLQPEEYLWYHRQVCVPACQPGWHYLLHFGAVDQECTVFINGQEMLSHHGGYLPFQVDLGPVTDDETQDRIHNESTMQALSDEPSQSIKDTSHTSSVYDIVLRVRDASDTSYYSRGKQKLQRGGMFYTAQSGIWQTVWMEMVPDRYISYVKITPDYDHSCCHVKVCVKSGDGEHHESSRTQYATEDDLIHKIPKKKKDTQEDFIHKMKDKKDALKEGLIRRIHRKTESKEEKVIDDIIITSTLLESNQSSPVPDYGAIDYDVAGSSYESSLNDPTPYIDRQSGRRVTLHIPQMHAWSPEDPYLYRLIITAGEDQVECYVGMRIITKEMDENGHLRFFLNHKVCIQLGVLDQGYWPEGLYTAPSDQALIYDIQTMKDLGCNMVRKHLKIEPDRWYYHCDRLGMLVWQDMVNGGTSYQSWFVTYLATVLNTHHISIDDGPLSRWLLSRTDRQGRRIFLQEMADTVKCLYNHPCIVTWVPFNESWGQFDAAKVAALLKKQDPTRLIDHASGWFDQKAGDIVSLHYYFFKLRYKEEKDRVLALTEYGGYTWKHPEHTFCQDEYGYGSYRSQEELIDACHHLMYDTIWPAVRGGVSALIYTQLSDVEDEHNGILSYDREVIKIPDLYAHPVL